MNCKIRIILLTLTSNIITQQSGICKNRSQRIPLSCCRNYQLVENKCIECPPGSFGMNCQENCPPQYYGRMCRQKCSCCNQCDKIKGCGNATGGCDLEDGTESVQFHWPSILILLAGSFAVCFTCCIIMLCILRTKKPVSRGCVVSTTHEKDLTGCQNIYDYVGKESYNVLKLTTSDKE